MTDWWVIDDTGHKRGPHNSTQISYLLHLGSIGLRTEVYCEIDKSWKIFESCEQLRSEIAKSIGDVASKPPKSRLPMSEVPLVETIACQDQSCPKWPSCDLVFVWDRKEEMWLTYDEYVRACVEQGLLEGLPERVLADSDQIEQLLMESEKKVSGRVQVDEADDEPLSDPEKEAKRQKRRAYRERRKLKRDAGLWKKSKDNPNVYVSCLPQEVSESELAELFKQSGQLKIDMESGNPKVKLYGNGDALVSFAHVDSVQLAIDRFNEYELRPGVSISVQAASFESDHNPEDWLSREELEERAQLNREKRKKIIEFARKEKALRSAWDVADYQVNGASRRPVVVFSNCFEPKSEHSIDYDFIENELFKYAGRFGDVKKVKAIRDSLDGYVCVKFGAADSAKLCVASLEGVISVNGRQVAGFIHDGRDLSSRLLVRNLQEQEPKEPGWEEFLEDGESDSQDEDLFIRTE